MLPYTDSLTGLPNKAFFEARLTEAIRWARRRGCGLTLLCLDLDRFEDLNRLFGWETGDRLLREAAGRMTRALGPCDTLARTGDDEFAALIEGTGELACAAVTARRLLDQYADPYIFDCVSIRLSASIGIGLYPRDAEDAISLMHRADGALHKAKIEGRARSYPPC